MSIWFGPACLSFLSLHHEHVLVLTLGAQRRILFSIDRYPYYIVDKMFQAPNPLLQRSSNVLGLFQWVILPHCLEVHPSPFGGLLLGIAIIPQTNNLVDLCLS